MVDGGHPAAPAVDPGAVLAGDAEVRVDEPGGSNAAQADENFWTHQDKLIPQIADTGLLFLGLWVTVPGRAAFDDIGDIAVGAVNIDDGQHIIQQLSGRAYEGNALQILLFSRAFPHKQNVCISSANTEDHIVPGLAELTASAGIAGLL